MEIKWKMQSSLSGTVPVLRANTPGSVNGTLSVKAYSSKHFRFAAPESIQPLRPVPARTLSGSLNLARGILVSFNAFEFIRLLSKIKYKVDINFCQENHEQILISNS
jgi:hypothetical protein